MKSALILTLPDWHGAGPDHWLSRWELLHGPQRLEQHDWQRPLRGDWSARLQETVIDSPRPVVLVAHGLGCILAAWWAAHSGQAHRAQAALLVAPTDTEAEDARQRLPGWAPIAQQPLPFAALLVASRNDPHCRFERAQALASAWGAGLVDGGACGHFDATAALGDWPAGHALLASLKKD